MNSNRPQVGMILAAGLGNRLRPLTLTTPKPLIKVNGKALIDYAIEHLYEVGIKKIIVNTHYLAEQIHIHLDKYKNSNIKILISHEPELLETAGGILNAMNNFTIEPLLVINSDIFLDKIGSYPVLLDLVEKWDPEVMEGLFYLKDYKDIDYYYAGDFNLNAEGKLVRCQNNNQFIFIGSYIISPNFFKEYEVKKFPLNEILFKANEENFNNCKFYGLELKSKWFDIGTIDRLNSLEEYLKRKNED